MALSIIKLRGAVRDRVPFLPPSSGFRCPPQSESDGCKVDSLAEGGMAEGPNFGTAEIRTYTTDDV